jgi:predicted DNA-binding protein YlxM (UPF0122 family)
MDNNQEIEWISVSQLAVQLNVSKQTIYNKIRQGAYQTKEFTRGSMRGLLVAYPKSKPFMQ